MVSGRYRGNLNFGLLTKIDFKPRFNTQREGNVGKSAQRHVAGPVQDLRDIGIGLVHTLGKVREIETIRARLIHAEQSGFTTMSRKEMLAEIKDEARRNGDL